MIKKYLSLVFALCLVISLFAGCGADGNVEIIEEPDQTQTTAPETTGVQTDEDPVKTVTLAKDQLYLKNAGETYTLYEGDIAYDDITWSSEDPAVATFEDGIVTAVANGETTVHAEYNGERVSCKVNCEIKREEDPTDPDTGNENTGTTGSREPVKAAPSTQVVDASFFDDAVFIGDSISLKLSQYAASSHELGKAKFLVIGSYGVSNAINDHPDTKLSYQGTTYTDFEKALAATGAKKVFIMLGMNDIGLYGIDKTIENWGTMLEMIHTTCPDMTVYIQSMTPVWTGGEKGKLNNENVNKYNERLKTFAQNNGYKFIDIAPYMKDSTGGLATKFCSDSYVHLTNEGAQTWIKVLKAYTGY